MLSLASESQYRTLRFAFCLVTALVVYATADAEDRLFRRHVLNADTDYSAACVMDVNHDGVLDVVCGGDWYEGPKWKRHFVAEIPRINGRPDGFAHLAFDLHCIGGAAGRDPRHSSGVSLCHDFTWGIRGTSTA